MKIGLLVVALAGFAACSSEADVGAEACSIYQEAVADDPRAVASIFALPEIKEMLPDLDDPTRRAFGDLITAADSGLDGVGRTVDAAAEVRSICLTEHGVEIAGR